MVQHTRISTSATFPPLDENNCTEMRYFVTTAKDFRDAIVHASASFDPIAEYPKKERLFGALDQAEVTKVVDAASHIVGRIGVLVNGQSPAWLHPRAENGLFPEEVLE